MSKIAILLDGNRRYSDPEQDESLIRKMQSVYYTMLSNNIAGGLIGTKAAIESYLVMYMAAWCNLRSWETPGSRALWELVLSDVQDNESITGYPNQAATLSQIKAWLQAQVYCPPPGQAKTVLPVTGYYPQAYTDEATGAALQSLAIEMVYTPSADLRSALAEIELGNDVMIKIDATSLPETSIITRKYAPILEIINAGKACGASFVLPRDF